MDKRDVVLQRSCPILQAPKFSQFIPLEVPGERIVVASNGVFIEVHRKWGYFIRKAGQVGVTVPYGEMSEATIIRTPALPKHLLKSFDQIAQEDPTVEVGASVVWNETTNEFRLVRSESILATGTKLKYRIPRLDDKDHIVIDCHSHGGGNPYFSPEDNEDDLHAVKLSYVVGRCHETNPTSVMRICIKGIFQNLPRW